MLVEQEGPLTNISRQMRVEVSTSGQRDLEPPVVLLLIGGSAHTSMSRAAFCYILDRLLPSMETILLYISLPPPSPNSAALSVASHDRDLAIRGWQGHFSHGCSREIRGCAAGRRTFQWHSRCYANVGRAMTALHLHLIVTA